MEKKLFRSRYGTIAGVCDGLAKYFGVETIFIQALFVILIWTPFPIIFTYIFFWLFMKKEPKL